MSVNANAVRCHPSLGVGVLVAEGGIGPRPAGTYHQRLKVILACKAHCYGTVVLVVILHLVTRHWAAGDESDKSLRRQRTGVPFAVVTGLELLRRVNPEQANKLLAELYGVAIGYCEAKQSSGAVDI